MRLRNLEILFRYVRRESFDYFAMPAMLLSMSQLVDDYRKQIRTVLGGIATWMPGDKVRVGDIGTFAGNRFRRQSSLKELGFEARTRSGNPQPWRYASASTKSVEASAAVDAGAAAGSFDVSFSKRGSYLFHAHNARLVEPVNATQLRDNVIAAYKGGDWDIDWYLIDGIYQADRATILIAQGEDAKVSLSVAGSIGLAQLPLAHPEVNVAITSSKGEVLQFLNLEDATPLFTCRRLKKRFFGGQDLEPVRDANDSLRWTRIEPEDLPASDD